MNDKLNVRKIKINADREDELIGRMQKNIKNGTNSCTNKPKLGPNSCVHNPILGPNQYEHKDADLPKEIIEKLSETKQDKYEMVDHPQHYNNYDIEVIDMMERIWGREATALFCEMNAYKYRMRMGTKPGDDDTKESMKKKLLEDFEKEQWYLKKAKDLKRVYVCP